MSSSLPGLTGGLGFALEKQPDHLLLGQPSLLPSGRRNVHILMLQGPELCCSLVPPGQPEEATSEFWKLPPAQSHTQLSVGAQLQPFCVVGTLEEKNVHLCSQQQFECEPHLVGAAGRTPCR